MDKPPKNQNENKNLRDKTQIDKYFVKISQEIPCSN